MDTFDSLLQAIQVMSPSQLRALAESAGVPEYTLAKIKSGETQNPRVRTVEKLSAALLGRSAAPVADERVPA